jgi:hypothetical protein
MTRNTLAVSRDASVRLRNVLRYKRRGWLDAEFYDIGACVQGGEGNDNLCPDDPFDDSCSEKGKFAIVRKRSSLRGW